MQHNLLKHPCPTVRKAFFAPGYVAV